MACVTFSTMAASRLSEAIASFYIALMRTDLGEYIHFCNPSKEGKS